MALKCLLIPNLFDWAVWLWMDTKLSHQSFMIKSGLFFFDRWRSIYWEYRRIIREDVTAQKNVSTELSIKRQKSPQRWSHNFLHDPLDFSDESDVISALNYTLSYFSEGNLEDIEW